MTEHRTKARTKGQWRRSRGGRPRKPDAAREPSGAICKAAREPSGPVALPETLAQRARRWGLPVGDEANNAIDAMWWRGLLGPKGGDGAKRRSTLEIYRQLWVDWRGMCGSPGRWRADQRPSGTDLSLESWRHCDDQMAACDIALRKLPCCLLVLSVLETVCIDDVTPPALLEYRAAPSAIVEKNTTALLSGIDAIASVLNSRKIPERKRPEWEEKKHLFKTSTN